MTPHLPGYLRGMQSFPRTKPEVVCGVNSMHKLRLHTDVYRLRNGAEGPVSRS